MKKILFTLLLIFTFNYSFADSYPEIIGEASYYSNRLHGRKTSSGELYNMHKFTCAHKTYPFGTVLKVTNLKNNAFIHSIMEILIIIKFILIHFQILVFISLISSIVRRLHDVGKSCWYLLLIFIPLIGLFLIFLLLIKDSFQETNIFLISLCGVNLF